MYKQITLLLILTLLFTACSSGGDEPAAGSDTMQMEGDDHDGEGMEGMDHEGMSHETDTDHEGMTHEHGDDADSRIDNPDGAAITITAPAAGASLKAGDSIKVEVAIENFVLNDNGSHWHVYVDGVSFGMVMGGRENSNLNGVEAGERMIEVYLANGGHEEFKLGDSIMVTVE